MTGTSPELEVAGNPVSETEPGMFLEGERDRAPIVCPMVVVFPDNWI